MDEFERIDRFFRPLTAGVPEALGLTDDAALVAAGPRQDYAITTDLVVSGRHFLPNDPPQTVAAKLLGVNLSDLAAMGAKPAFGFLGVALPAGTDDAWLDAFTGGLADRAAAWGLGIAGGDTVGTDGPLTLSLTALGLVPAGQALRRSGARPGDRLWVSGTIGDGALGLKAAYACQSDGTETTGCPDDDWLLNRYRCPEPRIGLGLSLRGIAHGAMDVSDGLVQDAGHIAKASQIRIEIDNEQVPLSPAALAWIGAGRADHLDCLTGGDDYELLFTVPDTPEAERQLSAIASAESVALTPIGRIVEGEGVVVLDGAGMPVPVSRAGFSHF